MRKKRNGQGPAKVWHVMTAKNGDRAEWAVCTTREEVQQHKTTWERCKWPGRPHTFQVKEVAQ